MSDAPSDSTPPTGGPAAGLEEVFLANRARIERFVRARGAGDTAEDLVQELWLKLASARTGPVANPMGYLMRAADTLMIDRFRAQRQSGVRDGHWHDAIDGWPPGASSEPAADRRLAAIEEAARVTALIDGLGERPARVFRRHRIDGVPQRTVAEELGVSLSTVEADLRIVYRALAEWRARFDVG